MARAWSAEIILFDKEGGPLTKRITLGANGQLENDASACVMVKGTAERVWIDTLHQAAETIIKLEQHQAIALGALRQGLPGQCTVMTDAALKQTNGTPRPNVIARTQEHIHFELRPGLVLADFDTKGMPAAILQRIDEFGGFEAALYSVLPELAQVGTISRASTSAGLFRDDTGERFLSSGGKHLYIQVADVTDSARFLKALHARCWLSGFGWLACGAAGQLLERSLVDRSVGQPERLVFEGPPVLTAPLAQDWRERKPVVREGGVLDTRAACPDLGVVEAATFRQLQAIEKQRVAPEAAAKRAVFIEHHAEEINNRTGIPVADARAIVEKQINGTLTPALMLSFDDPEFEGETVSDILANPERLSTLPLLIRSRASPTGAAKQKSCVVPMAGRSSTALHTAAPYTACAGVLRRSGRRSRSRKMLAPLTC
jgi:hypothetical protein